MVACAGLDGLTASNDGAKDPDAGLLAADADAQPATDAASTSDATDAADGGGFCATHPDHTACFDFDDATTLPSNLTRTTTSGANVEIDQEHGASPPRSLRGSITQAPSHARVEWKAPNATFDSLDLSLDFLLEVASLGQGAYTSLAVLHIDAGSGLFWQVGIAYSQQGLTLFTYGEGSDAGVVSDSRDTGDVVSYPQPERWYHAHLVVALGAGTASLDIDGRHADLSFALPSGLHTIARTVLLGVAYDNSSPSRPTAVRIDNVLLDVR